MAGNIRNALPNGTKLGEHYKIEECIGVGSFSIVYRARHGDNPDDVCAIKELFPSHLVSRKGKLVRPSSSGVVESYKKTLSGFLSEAKRLTRLGDCPGVVRCRNYFEENRTSYLVMEYVEGKCLRDMIAAYKERNDTFKPEVVKSWFEDLLSGLKEVHKAGLLHLDIRPDNVYIRHQDKKPVLLGFGAVRHEMGKRTESDSLVGTRPYAPYEQEHSHGELGPWTDIYALGMTFYELMFLDRDKLPSSSSRKAEDLLLPAVSREEGSVYTADFLELIDMCLSVDKENRPQSVEKVESSLPKKSAPLKESIAPRPRRLTELAVLIAFLVVLVSGSVMYFWLLPAPPDSKPAPSELEPREPPDAAAHEIEMVKLSEGSFLMGSESGELYEQPVHRVEIKPFAIGKYEVLGFQYRAFEKATDRNAAKYWGDKAPVTNVSWDDAQAYIDWLNKQNKQTGLNYRLPTEAEWEYAIRAGSTTTYHFGDDEKDLSIYANYGRHNRGPMEAGSFRSNAWGIYDMLGNVWEWVEDCWHEDYSGAPSDGRPAWVEGCDLVNEAVVRGGSWDADAWLLRSANRGQTPRTNRGNLIGFRLAQDL